MAHIHPTAVVDPKARLADSVRIGPYCIVGPDVELGERVELISHAVVEGHTVIGEGTRIFPFAAIGQIPQDLKYKGEAGRLEIGSDVIIREHVTVNIGTEGGGMLTKVGNRCMLAIGCHVAHDCIIGDSVLVMNHVLLGGHVVIGDFAVLGGGSAVHQFARIGKHAMIGGLSGVENDVIPYGTVMGNRARLEGLNLVGIKRRGYSREEIHGLRNAYKDLFLSSDDTVLSDRVQAVKATYAGLSAVKDVIDFIEADSSRALCRPAAGGHAS